MALFNFIYQTLDNIDGKQARRTGSSTPLGMMMDHGCDALGLPFIILGVAGICLVRDEVTILYTGQAGALFGFWISVWAQYHSKGIMILGKVNAVDDGIPTISVLALASFFFGQDFWVAPLYG
jgi:ethanolaminephosphotransferase